MKQNFVLSATMGLLLFSGQMSFAATKNSAGTGNWTAASSWSPSGAPSAGDVINIQSGHTISVNSNVNLSSGSATTINVYGTLAMVGNGSKLRLPSGSSIFVFSGGSITGNGSNSQDISIGVSVVYSGAMNTVPGPQTVTETSPLPVEWLSLRATRNAEGHVLITWATASETDNDYFDVERSFDGSTYDVIGRVDGRGTTQEISDYQWIDKDAPANDLVYYRLRQVDFDGQYEYSKLMAVEPDGSITSGLTVSVFPNPAVDELHVDLGSDNKQPVDISFIDLLGNEVKRIGIEKGVQTGKLDIHGLKKGFYFLIVRAGEQVTSQRVLVH
jgi:hypothetical protein